MDAILTGTNALGAADWAELLLHFMLLSLLAIGGAITTAPDMHRYVVGERGWLGDAQFTASVALAQAAPGPNVLFVAVIGFNVGGLAGMLATMIGTLLPSTTLALLASRYGDRRASSRGVRAFIAGLAPLTIGLVLASGWILLEPTRGQIGATVLVTATVLLMLRTKASPLWAIAAGAVCGIAGWV